MSKRDFILTLIAVLLLLNLGFFVNKDSDINLNLNQNNRNKIEVNAKSGNKIDLNTCNVEELKELQGIGEKKAKEIISNRPYKNIYELLENHIVGEDCFLNIKERLVTNK